MQITRKKKHNNNWALAPRNDEGKKSKKIPDF